VQVNLGSIQFARAGTQAGRIRRMIDFPVTATSEQSILRTSLSCPASSPCADRPSIGHRNRTESILAASIRFSGCSSPRFYRSKSLKHGYYEHRRNGTEGSNPNLSAIQSELHRKSAAPEFPNSSSNPPEKQSRGTWFASLCALFPGQIRFSEYIPVGDG